MKDIFDLVIGYFTLKKLQKGGFIKDEEFNLSFSQFIVGSIKAIKEIEKTRNKKRRVKKMRINRARRVQFSRTFLYQQKFVPWLRGGRRVF